MLTLCALILSACSPQISVDTETEREVCIQWRDSLPGRSRHDTEQTQAEIGRAYDIQAAACPKLKRFN